MDELTSEHSNPTRTRNIQRIHDNLGLFWVRYVKDSRWGGALESIGLKAMIRNKIDRLGRFPRLSAAEREWLVDIYSHDVSDLRVLTGDSVPEWYEFPVA